MVRTCFDSKALSSSGSSSSSMSSDEESPDVRGWTVGARKRSGGGGEGPALLPMTEEDFVLLDRLERRVDVQSFATVLKAYLIVRNRVAAIRADREFKRRHLSLPDAGGEREGGRKVPISGPSSGGPAALQLKKCSSRVALMNSHKHRRESGPLDDLGEAQEKQKPRLIRRLWLFRRNSRDEQLFNSNSNSPAAAAAGGDAAEYPKSVNAWEANSVDLLEQRLSFLGCRTVTSVGDGNCQFRSCSLNLFGSEGFHGFVRREAVAQMRRQRAVYGVFFETPQLLECYLRDMSRSGTWGDELSLRAIADAFCCSIHLITSTPSSWYLRYDPENDGRKMQPKRHLFLTYISPIHYNAFALKDTRNATALTPHT
ncbi:OTU-like cysteine protease domain-containing protein, putative [Eimeria maxima]|uniref:OTU-like cysteine protease domain-containing protein, putative n=1 Tax=Eimeria maxima TaxID=5804 RepID=U6M3Z4_EIMMA|nr:OTU-like cysteine protease domain-containing protein, putative [Eimeria maxima]CDJ57788.1 OTU-like cysteine protease domain-containing protein, putative [Eimeria maxima]